MRKGIRELLLAALTTIAVACSTDDPQWSEAPSPPVAAAEASLRGGAPSTWIADWTLLVFAANDDLDPNLVAAFDQDALEWQHGLGGSALFRILVERDYAPFQLDAQGNARSSERYALYREEQMNPESGAPGTMSLGETDTGDPKTLRDFLVYGIRAFPARHYWVTFTGHGDGWNGLADDTTAGRRLDVAGLRSALAEASSVVANDIRRRPGLGGPSTSNRIDVVTFDVCRFGAIENASALAGVADFMIASQESMPDAGHPYASLRYIAQDRPGSSPRTLVDAVVTDYVRAYVDGISTAGRAYVGTSITSVGLDLRDMRPLEAAIARLVFTVRRAKPKGFSCAEVSSLLAEACGSAGIYAPRPHRRGVRRGKRDRTPAAEASVDLVALLERIADPSRPCTGVASPALARAIHDAARDVLEVIGRPALASPNVPSGVPLQYGGQYRHIVGYDPLGPFVVEAQRVDPGTGARRGGLSILWGNPFDLLLIDKGTTLFDTYRASPFEKRTGWTGIMQACLEQAEACRAGTPYPGMSDPCEGL